jgi:hypothetical protein
MSIDDGLGLGREVICYIHRLTNKGEGEVYPDSSPRRVVPPYFLLVRFSLSMEITMLL